MDDFGRVCPEEDGAPCQDIALTFWAFGRSRDCLQGFAGFPVQYRSVQSPPVESSECLQYCTDVEQLAVERPGRFCQLLASTVLLAFLERRLDHKRLPTRFGTSERWQHMMQLFLRYYCKLARNDCPSTMPKSSPMRSGQLEIQQCLAAARWMHRGCRARRDWRIRCPKSCQYSVENGQHGAHKRACVRCHWEALS